MSEKPILFSGPMVRAILDGRKTQTRRVVKPKHLSYIDEHQGFREDCNAEVCPYGKPGDRLWVREAWAYHVQAIGSVTDEDGPFVYRADPMAEQQRLCDRWRPSIHMPRWASRILLEITAVRVERLNDISDADSLAEGVYPVSTGLYSGAAKAEYLKLWESINGPGSWAANPWVWVISFKQVSQEKK